MTTLQDEVNTRKAIKTRQEFRSSVIENRDVGVDGASGGAYLLQAEMHNELIMAEAKQSVMRQICRVLPPINADEIPAPMMETGLTDAEWVSETGSGTVDASNPFGQRVLRPKGMKKTVKVSRRLFRSPFADQYVVEAIANSIATPQEKAFIQGKGAGEPLGLLNTPWLPIYTTQLDLIVTHSDIRSWVFSLPARFLKNARILTSKEFISYYCQMREVNNQGQDFEFKGTIENVPVSLTDGMPALTPSVLYGATLTSGQIVAVIGDFQYYWIQDSDNLLIDRLYELYTATNQIGYRAYQETDGLLIVGQAFYALQVK